MAKHKPPAKASQQVEVGLLHRRLDCTASVGPGKKASRTRAFIRTSEGVNTGVLLSKGILWPHQGSLLGQSRMLSWLGDL